MPSHPTAKKVLKAKRSTQLTIFAAGVSTAPRTASKTIVKVCVIAPNIISFRRPTRSMRTIAMKEARKYSVPLHAARIRDLTSEMPRRSNRIVYEAIGKESPYIMVFRVPHSR